MTLKKISKKLRVKTVLCLTYLTVSAALSGCSTTSVYVLDQAELVKVKAGDTVTAKFDGFLFSNQAVRRVMDAKVDNVLTK